MPSLTKSLERRIQELKTSIESQRAEMAAYERVLEIELAHAGQSQQADTVETADGAQGKITSTEGQFSIDEASAGNAGTLARAIIHRGWDRAANRMARSKPYTEPSSPCHA